MHSWTSLTALSILLGVGPTYLQMDTDLGRSEGFEMIEDFVKEPPPGLPDLPGEARGEDAGKCWQQHWAQIFADLARRLEHCSEDVGTSAVVSFFFLTALLDLAVFFKLVFRFGCWCRQMFSKSTSTSSHVVQQLRLPCHPEHFEIHSEDEEITPRPVAMEDLEMQHLRLQLEEARAHIEAVEKDLLEQKEMNAVLKEELRQNEVQTDAVAVLQAELQVSQKELQECQEEANVMRVQQDALAELRNGKVPCQDCLSVFADWLKESFKEMAVQIPRQLQVIHDPSQQLQQHFSLRKMVTSTSSTRSKSGHDRRGKKASFESKK